MLGDREDNESPKFAQDGSAKRTTVLPNNNIVLADATTIENNFNWLS